MQANSNEVEMKKRIVVLGLIIILIVTILLISLTYYSQFYNELPGMVEVKSLNELQDRIGNRYPVPQIPDDTQINQIIIMYENMITNPKNLEKFDDEITGYHIHTDNYIIQAQMNNKVIINPYHRQGYKETVIVEDFPVYIILDSSENIANLTMLFIFKEMIIAINTYQETDNIETFYNENYSVFLEIITQMIYDIKTQKIW